MSLWYRFRPYKVYFHTRWQGSIPDDSSPSTIPKGIEAPTISAHKWRTIERTSTKSAESNAYWLDTATHHERLISNPSYAPPREAPHLILSSERLPCKSSNAHRPKAHPFQERIFLKAHPLSKGAPSLQRRTLSPMAPLLQRRTLCLFKGASSSQTLYSKARPFSKGASSSQTLYPKAHIFSKGAPSVSSNAHPLPKPSVQKYIHSPEAHTFFKGAVKTLQKRSFL